MFNICETMQLLARAELARGGGDTAAAIPLDAIIPGAHQHIGRVPHSFPVLE
jgi:hypothetical protein